MWFSSKLQKCIQQIERETRVSWWWECQPPFVGSDAIVRQPFFPYLTCSDLESEPHSGIFGLAESNFEVKIWKFKMAAPIWQSKITNFTWFRWKFVLHDFWGRSLKKNTKENKNINPHENQDLLKSSRFLHFRPPYCTAILNVWISSSDS